jgi:hypothetical protein
MTRSGLFCRLSIFGLSLTVSTLFAGCQDDAPATPPVAGTTGTVTAGGAAVSGIAGAGTVAGSAATAGQTALAGAGGVGMMPSPVGAAGMGAAGTGVAGMTAVAGMSAAGTGASGMGAGGMGAAGAPGFTPGSPTFSAIFAETIMGTGCNGGTTCHASTAAGQLKMANRADAYIALVGVKAMGINLVMNGSPNCKDSTLTRVVAGDPMASLLYTKVTAATPACGLKMPPTGATLAADKAEQIRLWIMGGAKDD